MKDFKQEIKQIFARHFLEKNLVLFVKRMAVLIAVMLIIENVFGSNLSDFLNIIIVGVMLICFAYTLYSYLIYRLKETVEAIKELIAMIKNL